LTVPCSLLTDVAPRLLMGRRLAAGIAVRAPGSIAAQKKSCRESSPAAFIGCESRGSQEQQKQQEPNTNLAETQ
jgi:hypothetical protein